MKTFIGKFNLKQYRDGKLIADIDSYNNATIQGMKRILDVMFSNISPGILVVGLINNSPAPAISVNDTIASHAGWVELMITGGLYPQLIQVAASLRQNITELETSPNYGAPFVATSAGTAKGIFIRTFDNLYLWSESLFAGTVIISIGDILFVTYQVTIT